MINYREATGSYIGEANGRRGLSEVSLSGLILVPSLHLWWVELLSCPWSGAGDGGEETFIRLIYALVFGG